MTKADSLYARFEAFEEQLAHCYFVLHERFITNPPLARFWAETAMEELQHSAILRFCRERGLTVMDFDLDTKTVENIDDLLDTAKSIAADAEVTIDEAFYASLLMESSELDSIYEKLTASLAKDHYLLYQAIHAGLRGHYQGFAEAVETFSGDKGLAEAFREFEKRERRVS